MSNRCPSCGLLASLDMGEIEELSADISRDKIDNGITTATISGSFRIVRTSSCCGDEIKEAIIDLETEIKIEGHTNEDCALEFGGSDLSPIEEGGGRYKKSYFGVEWTPEIICSCGEAVKIITEDGNETSCLSLSDKVAASAMDDLN